MADSTSRWAEALREMSGRLEEMPGEEGYPAYLGTRIAAFYERSGRVKCLGKDKREGTLTIIGSVSPPGGDLSEPVVQNTLRIVKVFWGLDSNLAYKRHFPAINWLLSYSLYLDNLLEFYHEKINEEWINNRNEAMKLLQREAELEEIVRLVGYDSLSQKEQLILLVTKSIREDFLHQSAYMEGDEFTSLFKQFSMLKIILKFYELANNALDNGITVNEISGLPIMEKLAKMKIVPENKLNEIENLENEIKNLSSSFTAHSSVK
jgi:V/A-type H+-transporting ATPase subunit A